MSFPSRIRRNRTCDDVAKRGKSGIALLRSPRIVNPAVRLKGSVMTSVLPALIVVDVQRAFDEWEAAGKRRNNPDAVARIVALLRAFRARGAPIVHIRHE